MLDDSLFLSFVGTCDDGLTLQLSFPSLNRNWAILCTLIPSCSAHTHTATRSSLPAVMLLLSSRLCSHSQAPQALEVQGVSWLNTLSSLQTGHLSSLLRLHGAPQHLPLAQAWSLRVILDSILSKSTNLHIFQSYSFCFIKASHIPLLLPTSPLNSATVFLSSIWPLVVLLGAQLLRDTFQRHSQDIRDGFSSLSATCLASSPALLCLFLPQQDGGAWTSQCHCFHS